MYFTTGARRRSDPSAARAPRAIREAVREPSRTQACRRSDSSASSSTPARSRRRGPRCSRDAAEMLPRCSRDECRLVEREEPGRGECGRGDVTVTPLPPTPLPRLFRSCLSASTASSRASPSTTLRTSSRGATPPPAGRRGGGEGASHSCGGWCESRHERVLGWFIEDLLKQSNHDPRSEQATPPPAAGSWAGRGPSGAPRPRL